MMDKKYLMKGMGALALLATFTGCVNDVEGVSAEEEAAKAKENAELMLGIEIPDGQTWDMASQTSASVTVNGDYDANYEVTIYENNPFASDEAIVLGKVDVKSGNTANFTFTCPTGVKGVFAAIKDEKGYSYVKPVVISEGKLVTSFGGETAASAPRRAVTRGSAADDYTIPTYAQPEVDEYWDGAVEIDDQNAAGDIWDGPNVTSYKKLKMTADWNKKITVLGYTNSEQGLYARTLYIENATWTVTADQPTLGQGTVIVVGDNGEINIPAGVTLNTSGNPDYNCQIIVLPTGKITGKGKISFNNGSQAGKYDYIGGTVDVGTINNNGGEVYIAGTLKADNLEGGAGNSTYINAGKVVVGGSVYGSTSANMVIENNCWWECNGDISCRNIIQGEGAYFHAKSLAMSCSEDGTYRFKGSCIYAKANSLIDIEGAVAFNNTNIVGPTDDYAYLQFGSVGMKDCATNYSTVWVDGKESMTTCIQNNFRLSVDHPNISADTNGKVYGPTDYEKLLNMLNGTKSYSVDAYNDAWSQWGTWTEMPVVGNGNAVLVNKGEYTAATVEESECSPGIDPKEPTPIIEAPKVYTYAFEDQVGGDYDMNDVVLKVNYHVEKNNKGVITKVDSTKLDFKLVAAGAEFSIKVRVGGTATNRTTPEGYKLTNVDLDGGTYLFDGQEIHAALGVDAGKMVNTNGTKTITAEPITDTVDAPAGWDNDFTHLRVSIEVLTTENNFTYPNDDIYPHALMIPTDWAWPVERTSVAEAYAYTNGSGLITESFVWWAQTSPHPASAELWYTHPVSGKVVNNQ